jgi:uncharacterized membrane protein
MIDIIPNWHPIVVHFALALPLMATLLYGLSALLQGNAGHGALIAAHWNLGLGVVWLWLAVGTGMSAYLSVQYDAEGFATLRVHQWWAWTTAAIYTAAAGLTLAQDAPRRVTPLLLLLCALGTGSAVVTGWLGAENVYRHGIGVERLPEPDATEAPRPSDHRGAHEAAQ